ncbi:MAG: hypothetical protein PVI43_00915 [Candidatus Bathyarchaeota archaeon]|jgi:hypothetical protein
MAKVVFEFDYHEDNEEIEKMLRYNDMAISMHDIYYLARNKLKHYDEDLSNQAVAILEEIQELAAPYI